MPENKPPKPLPPNDVETDMEVIDEGYGFWLVRDKKYPISLLLGGDDHIYLVVYGENKKWWCSCVGFQYHQRCKHIKYLTSTLKNQRNEILKRY